MLLVARVTAAAAELQTRWVLDQMRWGCVFVAFKGADSPGMLQARGSAADAAAVPPAARPVCAARVLLPKHAASCCDVWGGYKQTGLLLFYRVSGLGRAAAAVARGAAACALCAGLVYRCEAGGQSPPVPQ